MFHFHDLNIPHISNLILQKVPKGHRLQLPQAGKTAGSEALKYCILDIK